MDEAPCCSSSWALNVTATPSTIFIDNIKNHAEEMYRCSLELRRLRAEASDEALMDALRKVNYIKGRIQLLTEDAHKEFFELKNAYEARAAEQPPRCQAPVPPSSDADDDDDDAENDGPGPSKRYRLEIPAGKYKKKINI